MFIRGADQPREYAREDFSCYKGIVVKNNDPSKLHRVKVYIPELSNQPLTNWLNEYKTFNIRFPGINNINDSWTDVKMFEEMSQYIQWAEPCFPLMGESGVGVFNSPDGTATISDSNYYDSENDTKPPTVEAGNYAPSFLYENITTSIHDAFTNPIDNFMVNANPYSYLTRPSSHTNKSKGIFGIPNVGSRVWVFHYKGDINFPVYFGVYHDFRETSLINNLDQPDSKLQSIDYPSIAENINTQQ